MAGLRANPETARADYDEGVKAGDFSRAHATVGEAVGLITDIPTASSLLYRITVQASKLMPSH
jgi:nitronate monooxygenase